MQHRLSGKLGTDQNIGQYPSNGCHLADILADACLCISEVMRAKYLPLQGLWWDSCAICTHDLAESAYKCRSCQETILCLHCRSAYMKCGRTVPAGYKALDQARLKYAIPHIDTVSLQNRYRIVVSILVLIQTSLQGPPVPKITLTKNHIKSRTLDKHYIN